MSAVATAIVGSAVVGYVASSKASAAQSKAAGKASDAEMAMYNQTREDQAPYRAIGNSALAQLGYGIGVPQSAQSSALQTEENFDPAAYLRQNPDVASGWDTSNKSVYDHYLMYGQKEGRPFTFMPGAQAQLDQFSGSGPRSNGIGLGEFNKKFTLSDYQEDPGYKFRLDQGSQALERSAAARGGLLSGGHLKDLTDYQQGVASQEYGNAYNRFNNDQSSRFNRLAALAGIGQTSNNTMASIGANTASNIGSNLVGAGNAAAAGYVGGANAINSAVGQGVSAYQTNQLLGKIAPAKVA